MNAPQAGQPLPSNVGDKLKQFLTEMEQNERSTGASPRGRIDISMQEGEAMWKVSYETAAAVVE